MSIELFKELIIKKKKLRTVKYSFFDKKNYNFYIHK